MAAKLIRPTETMEVKSIVMLIYGPPGAWKTSIAQTAEDPITLDFDRGAHRSFNRKDVLQFDTWKDVSEADAEVKGHKTVVIDTIGRLLDLMTLDIISASTKNGTSHGGLSISGWGVLKTRFGQWGSMLRMAGKDVVMLCHEKEEKEGDNRIMRPDIQGGSYGEVMKFTDLVGILAPDYSGNARVLNFNPSDRHVGKNCAGWSPLTVPDLSKEPKFLAGLISQAKASIGKTAAASAELAAVEDQWQDRLDSEPDLKVFNGYLSDLGGLTATAKKRAWDMCLAYAKAQNWTFDKATKVFLPAATETKHVEANDLPGV